MPLSPPIPKTETERLAALRGHEFGHRVVAEGIETAQAFELLASWGCDEGQGYWIARPMPAAALEAWLAART